MKYSLLIITLLGILISSCQSELTCDDLILKSVDKENLYADSTTAILLDCGKLDSLDMELTKTPFFTEIVNLDEFTEGKYNIKRFVADFQRFAKTEKYSSIKSMMVMKTKKYSAEDWASDKEKLIQQFQLSKDDIALLEPIVKNPANASLSYPEAIKKMNEVKVQKLIEQAEKMNAQK